MRCDLLPPQCAHAQRQSRQTRYHDNISIPPENTNNHGSSQCGKTWKCAASGATNPTTANNIGRPQQNICGNIVAKIPILTALFFIDSSLVVLAIIYVFTIIEIDGTSGANNFLAAPLLKVKLLSALVSEPAFVDGLTFAEAEFFSTRAFHDHAPVYLFTNENIYGTLKTAGDISNKKILTVGASGDHVFESYLLGARDVHTFDINSSQKNVIELKNHMIRELS